MRSVFFGCGIALAGIAVLSVAGTAQERPVGWILHSPDPPALSPGNRTSLRLQARIDAGWYVYAPSQPAGGPFPMSIHFAERAPLRLDGEIDGPKPDLYPDRNFNIFSHVYEGAADFVLPVRVASEVREPDDRTALLVRYQACNDRYCLPPRTDTLALSLALPVSALSEPERSEPTVGVGGAAGTTVDAEKTSPSRTDAADRAERGSMTASGSRLPTSADESPPSAPPTAAESSLAEGESSDSLAQFLLLAVTLGLLSLLTPCVFPLVPITVGFFAKRTGEPRLANLRAAVAYGIGIVVTFSALGLAVALLFGAGGIVRLAANPWLNLAVAALFVTFAMNLLGAWQISLPSRLLSRVSTVGGRASGLSGAVMMGGTFSLTSFTCTAPFIGTLLVLATQGNWRWPLLGLTAYAAAFAFPFFVLALIPGAVARLPRSGSWMATLKGTLGILELAAAVKFVSNADLVWHWNVFSREVVLGLWIVAGLALSALFLIQPHFQRVPRPGWPRALLATGSLAGVAWLITGLSGSRLGELEAYLPPARSDEGVELAWRLNDYDGSLMAARVENRPVLIDFTGYTCTNCRWMEANMFPRPEVHVRLEGFVRVRLFTDGQGAVYEGQQALQQKLFGTVALPYYAILSPSGEPVATFLGMTRDAGEFVQFLERGLALHSPLVQAVQPGI
jgi:thiol:disulfide interchange protein